jgi:hypothetical protein
MVRVDMGILVRFSLFPCLGWVEMDGAAYWSGVVRARQQNGLEQCGLESDQKIRNGLKPWVQPAAVDRVSTGRYATPAAHVIPAKQSRGQTQRPAIFAPPWCEPAGPTRMGHVVWGSVAAKTAWCGVVWGQSTSLLDWGGLGKDVKSFGVVRIWCRFRPILRLIRNQHTVN